MLAVWGATPLVCDNIRGVCVCVCEKGAECVELDSQGGAWVWRDAWRVKACA